MTSGSHLPQVGGVSGFEIEEKPKFARVLNIFSLTFLGLGSTIGGGVFTLSGIAASKAGSDVWMAWLISGTVILLSAFVYAELATRIQKSGSSYIYTYIISGELIAFMVGWNMFMEFGATTSAQSQAFNSFLLGFLKQNGVDHYVPGWISDASIAGVKVYPISALFIFMCTFVITLGSKKSDTTNRIITAGKILMIVFLIIIAQMHQNPKNFEA